MQILGTLQPQELNLVMLYKANVDRASIELKMMTEAYQSLLGRVASKYELPNNFEIDPKNGQLVCQEPDPPVAVSVPDIQTVDAEQPAEAIEAELVEEAG